MAAGGCAAVLLATFFNVYCFLNTPWMLTYDAHDVLMYCEPGMDYTIGFRKDFHGLIGQKCIAGLK